MYMCVWGMGNGSVAIAVAFTRTRRQERFIVGSGCATRKGNTVPGEKAKASRNSQYSSVDSTLIFDEISLTH